MAQINVRQKHLVTVAKMLVRLCLPHRVRNSMFFVFFRNWMFQGVALMHWTEFLFRECIELMLLLLFGVVFSQLGIVQLPAMLLGALVVHTLMWTLNGHFWALHVSEKVRLVQNTPVKIIRYLNGLERRMRHAQPINACILSGSLTLMQFHKFSDLDIWLTKKKGVLNGICAYALGVRERTIAFCLRIPIELYFYDPIDFIGKDPGEKLILIKDHDSRWRAKAPSSIWLWEYAFASTKFFKEGILQNKSTEDNRA